MITQKGAFHNFIGSVIITLSLILFTNPLSASEKAQIEQDSPATDLLDMSLEELMKIEVVTSGRRSQPITHATSAIYVITAEDIHAAGATTLADILRFVPGVDVAQDTGYRHALGIRGFARPSSERIEILMDGRPLYDGLRGGVELHYHPLFFENIERIEVIRGPAGVMWGVNAENGVINIIMKKPADTLGSLLYGGIGNRELQQGYMRFGAADGPLAWRGAVGAYHDNGFGRGGGDDTKDFYQAFQSTGRADYKLDDRTDLIISGGHKNNTLGAATPAHDSVQYMNVLWERQLTDESSLLLRWSENFYKNNNMPSHILYTRKDMVEVQHSMRSGAHNFIWGADYIKDSYKTRLGTLVDFMNPDSFSNDQGSLLAEDEITLAKNLWFTLGGRAHYNELTHSDWAARGALIWEVRPKHFLRAAISRSFRRPIMYETLPNKYNARGTLALRGNPSLENEQVLNHELGYRGQFSDNLQLDIVGFYNRYSHIIGNLGGQYQNTYDMETYGLETAVDYKPYTWWLVRAGHSYEYQSKGVEINDRATGRLAVWLPPKHKVFMTNRFYIDKTTTLNTQLYWSDPQISRLGSPVNEIDQYFKFDIRLAKRLWSDSAELAVGFNNLTEHFHNEIRNTVDEVPRQFYAQFFYYF